MGRRHSWSITILLSLVALGTVVVEICNVFSFLCYFVRLPDQRVE